MLIFVIVIFLLDEFDIEFIFEVFKVKRSWKFRVKCVGLGLVIDSLSCFLSFGFEDEDVEVDKRVVKKVKFEEDVKNEVEER